MSSSCRTTASEDGMLASLERGSTASQLSRSWMIAGGSVAALLAAIVAWLAYSNATSVRALPASAVRRASPPAPAEVPLPARSLDPAGELAGSRLPAAIVDEQAGAASAAPAAEPARPPLVMLPPEEGGMAKPLAVLPPEETVTAHAPPPEATASEKPAAPAAAPAPARAKPPIPMPAKRAANAPRAAAKPLRTATARPAVLNKPKKVPTPKPAAPKPAAPKPAAPKPAAPEVVDSDVALLSAILAHANRHAAEQAQEKACLDGKKCQPKAQAEP